MRRFGSDVRHEQTRHTHGCFTSIVACQSFSGLLGTNLPDFLNTQSCVIFAKIKQKKKAKKGANVGKMKNNTEMIA